MFMMEVIVGLHPRHYFRILEFAVNVDGRSIDGSRVERDVKILVELWDMSGNKQ